MKKIYWFAPVLAIALSCSEETPLTDRSAEFRIEEPAQRGCASYDVLQEEIRQDPSRGKRLEEIEAFIQKAQRNPEQYRLVNGVIEIPVWVNVIYNQNKPAENVSQAQIQSQIDVLNEDFNATNSDYNQVPNIFSGVKANVGIRFVLEGVTRKASKKTSWRTDNSCKSSAKGGISPTSPTTFMNMWVCVLANNILGYAQFPGGNSATDGVVIHTNAFGKGSYPLFPTFNLGRTATHEVGHWLNLRHIWGDATCGSDLVNDTPTHNTSNTGCPGTGHKSTCSGTPDEMWMNYMDYTDDRCMYMFSAGQKVRMDATFASGGGRNTFAQP